MEEEGQAHNIHPNHRSVTYFFLLRFFLGVSSVFFVAFLLVTRVGIRVRIRITRIAAVRVRILRKRKGEREGQLGDGYRRKWIVRDVRD